MTWRSAWPARAAAALLLAVLALGAGACGPSRPPGGSLAGLVAAGAFTAGNPGGGARGDRPLRFTAKPRAGVVKLDDESRPAVTLPAGTWWWRTRVPADGWLQVGLGAPDGGPLEASVVLDDGTRREVLEVGRNDPREDEPDVRGWIDFGADLSRWAGRDVTLALTARRPLSDDPAGSPGASGTAPEVAWGPVTVSAPRAVGKEDPPNVLFILVDTLRHDHLTPYGYKRDTTPEIEKLLAERGTVLEDAYSQAPWTLPSVISFMTSRYPGELLGGDPAGFGLPKDVPALAATFAKLGYRTGGFIGNPILHAGNGFARGFDTFYTPEDPGAITRHAESVNRRAVPWLRAHQGERFFGYVHYVDPHDPYDDPDVVDNRSRLFEDPGGMPGTYVQGVYAGKLHPDDLDREVRHFTALYDTEVHWVDRAIGALLRSLPPDVLAHTLIVLTADHGEELHDHGGWKHGQTLYEDQIHVPLIVRWDGRIPAGKRLAGTVRLVDLLPTLTAAAGGEAAPSWEGRDLVDALEGRAPLPRLEAFAQRLQVGPLRAALVLDGKKLMLYNRQEPFTAQDGLQEYLYHFNLARMRGAELYDVRRDPGERHDLLTPGSGPAADAPEDSGPAGSDEALRLAASLDGPLQVHLARTFGLLRALTDSLPAGHRLAGELVFEKAPTSVMPLFLGDGDRAEAAGTTVRFDLVGDGLSKGFALLGDPGALVSASLTLDGEPLASGRLRVGAGTPFAGRRVEADALASKSFPAPSGRPGLRLWTFAGGPAAPGKVNAETRKGLEALGYVQ